MMDGIDSLRLLIDLLSTATVFENSTEGTTQVILLFCTHFVVMLINVSCRAGNSS